MKSVLITGGTGFFGQAFTERLLKNGLATRIVIYSRDEVKQYWMRQRFKEDERLRFFIGDVRDRLRLSRAFDGVDTVVHAAALKRIEVGHYNPNEMVKTNVIGAMNVVEAAHDAGVSKVIGLSSDKAFQPISPYGQTKALAESIFLAANNTQGAGGPRFAVTRYGNVWKSTGSVVPIWQQQIEDGADCVRITDPEATRFFMTTDQAIGLVLDTIQTMPDDPAIPTLPAYRLGDLADAMGVNTIQVGLPRWEKQHESMDEHRCSKFAHRMTVEELKAAL